MKENFIIQDGTVTWRTKRIYIDPDTGIQLSDIPIATSIKTGLMPAQSYTDLERLKERKLVDLPSNMVDANEKFLNAEGSWVSILDENTTYLSFNGATGSEAGTSGLVPAPEAGDNEKFLTAAGSWASIQTHQGAIVDQETYDILYNLVHQTETEYSVGERVYTKELPNNLVLECVTAGTTGSNFTIE